MSLFITKDPRKLHGLLVALAVLLVTASCGRQTQQKKKSWQRPEVQIVYDATKSVNRIAVCSLDADLISTRLESCNLSNVRIKLYIAEKINFDDRGETVRMLVRAATSDTMLCYPHVEGEMLEGKSDSATLQADFAPTDVVRINGKDMTFRKAAQELP